MGWVWASQSQKMQWGLLQVGFSYQSWAQQGSTPQSEYSRENQAGVWLQRAFLHPLQNGFWCLFLPSVSLPAVKLTSYTSPSAPLGLGGTRCWLQVHFLSSVPFFHQRRKDVHGWVPKLTERSGNWAAPSVIGDRLVRVNLSLGTQDLRARGQQASSLASQLPPPVPAIRWGHWEGRKSKKAEA